MKWLNSLDELLYEVMSWLLFLPITLWRATIHPLRTMADVERQRALPDDQQYSAALSPPLFLALTLLLAHSVSTALGQTDAIIANKHGLGSLVDDNASALVLRVVVFASFPLFVAARLVRARVGDLDRLTLRQPFYELCYPTAVFTLGLSLGTSLTDVSGTHMRMAGGALILCSVAHFCIVQTRWFATAVATSHVRAVGSVLIGLLQGTVFLLVVGFLFTR